MPFSYVLAFFCILVNICQFFAILLGTTTGYDFAGALPGLQNGQEGVGQEALFDENNKKFDVLKGDIEFAVKDVNVAESEFSGI